MKALEFKKNKKAILDSLEKSLAQWIEGIFEDDPLPPEIRHVYFAISGAGKKNFLQFGGSEFHEGKILNFDYFPLEAQFFFDNKFYRKKINCFKVFEIIQNALKISDFSEDFKGKIFHIGEFGKIPEISFLFKS